MVIVPLTVYSILHVPCCDTFAICQQITEPLEHAVCMQLDVLLDLIQEHGEHYALIAERIKRHVAGLKVGRARH